MATFTAPNGTKLRCESHRRYWVITQWASTQASVEFRTDDVTKARHKRSRVMGGAIFDSRTGSWL